MRVLVACEYSGRVRESFRMMGHDAWSCDLLPSDDGSPFHYTGDMRDLVDLGWDLLIAHPPCTYLCSSGLHWNKRVLGRQQLTEDALTFVWWIMNLPIPRIAIENPIGCISTRIRKPEQIIQPWQFGHGETKATCLWLKGLAPLKPTQIVEGRKARIHHLPPSKDRWKIRSETYAGIALAMAMQWGAP